MLHFSFGITNSHENYAFDSPAIPFPIASFADTMPMQEIRANGYVVYVYICSQCKISLKHTKASSNE